MQNMIKLPKKYKSMIATIDKEQDGYFIYTQAGFCISDLGLHTYSVDTLAEVKEAIKMIEPCDCEQCEEEKAQDRPWNVYSDCVYVGELKTVRGSI